MPDSNGSSGQVNDHAAAPGSPATTSYSIARWPGHRLDSMSLVRRLRNSSRGHDDGQKMHDGDSKEKTLEPDDTAQMSRWWLAGTVFPLTAGTLGPVASAFSICALVRPWRQQILPGTTIENAEFIDDPHWLVAINAVQLGIAITANMFLLLNMARRIRFSVAQPVTMIGWYISSLSLIALLATGTGDSSPLRSSFGAEDVKDLVWSQAFYYAIYSAVLYMVVASLMVITFVGAWRGHYSKDFQLTNSQRTLMLQTILFLIYLLLGAFIFSQIEGWAFLDAVYWADVTLFTVGFGDYAAESILGRALLFPYALIGVISLGLVIGSIRSLVLDRGKRRLDSRMAEKNRRQFLRRLSRKGDDDFLRPDGLSPVTGSATTASGSGSGALGLTEFQRRETEFNMMRRIQMGAAQRRRWTAVATSGGTWLLLWLLGAYIFQVCERPYQDWNYFDGFYLAFVSLTTIGYGDMTPVSNAGKSFFVFWSLLALPTTTILISDAGDTIVKGISDATNAIGRITILPGERGLRRDLKELVRALTCGAIFEDIDIEDMPPGLLGAAQQPPEEHEASMEEDEERQEEEAEEAVEEGEREVEEEKQRGRCGSRDRDDAEDGDGQAQGGGEGGDGDEDEDQDASTTGGNDEAHDEMSSLRTPNIREKQAAETGNLQELADERKQQQKQKRTLSWENKSSERMHNHSHGRSRTWGNKAVQNSSSHGSSSGFYQLGSSSANSVPRTDLPKDLPATRAEYLCVLVGEIARVTHHMRHASPPRKYTFHEWAWFLRLIGEDENSTERHLRASALQMATAHHRKATMPSGAVVAAEEKDEEVPTTGPDGAPLINSPAWSWVGPFSPLMSGQEEAEWILDKLTQRLQVELQADVERQKEGTEEETTEGLSRSLPRADISTGSMGTSSATATPPAQLPTSRRASPPSRPMSEEPS